MSEHRKLQETEKQLFLYNSKALIPKLLLESSDDNEKREKMDACIKQ